MNNNGHTLSGSLEATLRGMPAPEQAFEKIPDTSIADRLRNALAEPASGTAPTEFAMPPRGTAYDDEVTEAIPTTESTPPDSGEIAPAQPHHTTISKESLRALADPEYDLGISEADMERMRKDPSSRRGSIATELDQRLVAGNHSFTPTEGVGFEPPADSEPKAVVLRAPHEIDIEAVGKGVEQALMHVSEFDTQSVSVVEAARAVAHQRFQDAVDAFTVLEGAQAWMVKGRESSEKIAATIRQRFEAFHEKREVAWSAFETNNSIISNLEVCQNNLRNLNVNDVALNHYLTKAQQDSRENSQYMRAMITRYQEIQQTIKVDTNAGYFRESDIDMFDLQKPISSPEQQANFEGTMRILLAGLPEGTPSDAPEAIRLASSWSHVRHVIAAQVPVKEKELLKRSQDLTDRIALTGRSLEQNVIDIANEKTQIQNLQRQKRQHDADVYEPALRSMTEALAELEEAVGLAYVRSAQIKSITQQLASAQAAQIERRKEDDEAERRQTLQAIEPAATASSQYTGRRMNKDAQIDDRRFPQPEEETRVDHWDKIKAKLGSLILRKDK